MAEKAKILNDQFVSVFSKTNNITPTMGISKHPIMNDIVINEEGLLNLLQNIKTFKASGPDGIQSKFLKETSQEILPVLRILFEASLHQGVIPDDWRSAMITPIYKPGKTDRSKAENYRPVSLTSVVCKLLEHVIYSNIMGHFEKNHILHDNQHGFRKKRSCETQLLTTFNDLVQSYDEGKQIDSILLDFSKAYDKVDHEKLIVKLKFYGVNSKIVIWIKNFLYKRTQKVLVNGKESPSECVLSGVPQGSVLGPLLFLVYINDLPKEVSSTIRIFADDSYIYRVIETSNDNTLLQNDLNKLMEWENKWSMSFHPSKCKLLRITNKRNPILGDYVIHDKILESVETAKYLGVMLHKKLTWKPHVNMITKKANQTRGFLQRNLRGCSKEVKSQCYKTYVRPVVEYASTVWDPVGAGNKGLREKIEMVQRKAARFVFSDWRRLSSPTKMIAELKWSSLQERRSKARVMLFY